MSDHFGMPGPGGSLGKCALCGETFLAEILLGKSVLPFTIEGCAQTLYAHKGCADKYGNAEFTALPEASPIRQAWERDKARKETA